MELHNIYVALSIQMLFYSITLFNQKKTFGIIVLILKSNLDKLSNTYVLQNSETSVITTKKKEIRQEFLL